ncbi:hypothetical protein [Pectobacterium brasiliense]|uniref:hypothetical protein n=1 Tax=Pectobacterium brasiliense TaxID=180957 RepID=UPI000B95E201|nr:hypothetical protein [Pectobacterium carotovorum]OYN55591.1 hypothetical protein B7L52_10385 [Pectobacterium carotovorum]
MKVEYLFIGRGLDGQIKTDDYPQKKLMVTEVTVESAESGARGSPVKFFEVHQQTYNGKVYAVAIGRSTDSQEIKRLIDASGVNPIPNELL